MFINKKTDFPDDAETASPIRKIRFFVFQTATLMVTRQPIFRFKKPIIIIFLKFFLYNNVGGKLLLTFALQITNI